MRVGIYQTGDTMKQLHTAIIAASLAAGSASLWAQGLPTQKMITIDVAQTIAQV